MSDEAKDALKELIADVPKERLVFDYSGDYGKERRCRSGRSGRSSKGQAGRKDREP